jgi:hypothetical protein
MSQMGPWLPIPLRAMPLKAGMSKKPYIVNLVTALFDECVVVLDCCDHESVGMA